VYLQAAATMPQPQPWLVVCIIILCRFAPLVSATTHPPPIHHIYFALSTRTYDDLYSELSRLLRDSSRPAYDPPVPHR
jgi:hypothetical protein